MLVDPFQTHIKFGNHLKNPSLRTNSDEPISALSVRGEINAKRHKKSAASTRARTHNPQTQHLTTWRTELMAYCHHARGSWVGRVAVGRYRRNLSTLAKFEK